MNFINPLEGCTWKNVCKNANESWQDGCHSYQCQWVSGETGFSAVINATTVCEFCFLGNSR